jgi:hypothetical protein
VIALDSEEDNPLGTISDRITDDQVRKIRARPNTKAAQRITSI